MSSQFDLLATKEEYKIAVEVTQSTHQSAEEISNLLQEQNFFSEKKLTRNWSISIEPDAKIKLKKREDLINALEELEKNQYGYIKIELDTRSIPKNLEKLGIIYLYGAPVDNQPGSIHFHIQELGKASIFEVFRIIQEEASKPDNLEKLKSAKVNESHLFIALTGYGTNGAAWFITHCMPDEPIFFNNDKLTDMLGMHRKNNDLPATKDDRLIPEDIDVVWIATLRNFHPISQKIGYRLAKIINYRDGIRFEPVKKEVNTYF